MSGWIITPTNAGLHAAINASSNGVSLQIASIALGDANGVGYTPTLTEIALKNEFMRVPVSGARRVDDVTFQVQVSAQLPAGAVLSKDLWELGVYLSDGTLGFIASRTTAAFLPISNEFATKIGFALKLDRFPAGALNINMLPPIGDTYVLPPASLTRLGGVKASPSVNIDPNGVMSVDVPAIENSIFTWLSGLFLRLSGGTVTGDVALNASLYQNLGTLGTTAGDFRIVNETNVADADDDHFQTFWYRIVAGVNGLSAVLRLRRNINNIQRGFIDFAANRLEMGAGQNPAHFLIDETSVKSVHALDLTDNSWNVANTDFVQRKFGELNSNLAVAYYTKPQSDARFLPLTGGTLTGGFGVLGQATVNGVFTVNNQAVLNGTVTQTLGSLGVGANSYVLKNQSIVTVGNNVSLQDVWLRDATGGDWTTSSYHQRLIIDGGIQGDIAFANGGLKLGAGGNYPLRIDSANAYGITQAAGDASTKLATTSYVDGSIGNYAASHKTIIAKVDMPVGAGEIISAYNGSGVLSQSYGNGDAKTPYGKPAYKVFQYTFATPQPDTNYLILGSADCSLGDVVGLSNGFSPSYNGMSDNHFDAFQTPSNALPGVSIVTNKSTTGFGFTLVCLGPLNTPYISSLNLTIVR